VSDGGPPTAAVLRTQAPLALLLWRGPEDLSVPAPPVVAFTHSEPSAATGKSPSSPAAADSTARASIAAEAQPGSPAAAQDTYLSPRFTGPCFCLAACLP